MGELPNRCGSIQLIQPVVGIAGTHRSQRALGVLGAPFCIGPAQLDVLMHLARHSSILCRCKGWSGPWCPFDLYPAGWQYASVLCYTCLSLGSGGMSAPSGLGPNGLHLVVVELAFTPPLGVTLLDGGWPIRGHFRAGMRAGAYFHRSILSWVAYRW